MAETTSRVYQFAPLERYSVRQRLVVYLADRGFYFLIKAIGRTLTYKVEGWENFEAIREAGKLPIYSFWHNRVFAGTYFFRGRGIVVITSRSMDGEYIARFIQRLGYGAVRGSSTRGGVGALVEMIRLMRAGLSMAFTVDGPRGPRYEAKKGPVLLAKKTGNPMMPFVVESKSYWTVKSWDRLQVPRPFSKAKLIIGKPIYIAADADDDAVEAGRIELQRSLDELTLEGEKWRNAIT